MRTSISLKSLRTALATLLLITLWSGCDDTEQLPADPDRQEATRITVPLRIAAAAPTVVYGDGSNTRASSSMLPSEENLVYDMIVVQYKHTGLIASQVSRYIEYENGMLETKLTLSFEKDDMGSYICFLCNIGNSDDSPVYLRNDGVLMQRNPDGEDRPIDTAERFRQLLVSLPADEETTGHLTKMYMCGYYVGAVTEDQLSLDISLGRACARIEILIQNEMDAPFSGTIELKNVANKLRFQPNNSPAPFAEGDFTGYTEEVKELEPDGESYFCYYVGEHLNPPADKALLLQLTGNDGRTGSLELGVTPPGDPNPFRSIYRNTTYRFIVKLKHTHS